jgi:hypothetical protein
LGVNSFIFSISFVVNFIGGPCAAIALSSAVLADACAVLADVWAASGFIVGICASLAVSADVCGIGGYLCGNSFTVGCSGRRWVPAFQWQ